MYNKKISLEEITKETDLLLGNIDFKIKNLEIKKNKSVFDIILWVEDSGEHILRNKNIVSYKKEIYYIIKDILDTDGQMRYVSIDCTLCGNKNLLFHSNNKCKKCNAEFNFSSSSRDEKNNFDVFFEKISKHTNIKKEILISYYKINKKISNIISGADIIFDDNGKNIIGFLSNDNIKIKENPIELNDFIFSLYAENKDKKILNYHERKYENYHYIEEENIFDKKIIIACVSGYNDSVSILIECKEEDLLPYPKEQLNEDYGGDNYECAIWELIESAEADWSEIEGVYYYTYYIDLNKKTRTIKENIEILNKQIKIVYEKNLKNLAVLREQNKDCYK